MEWLSQLGKWIAYWLPRSFALGVLELLVTEYTTEELPSQRDHEVTVSDLQDYFESY